MVGSIQKTNDLDVHIALLSAPSYAMEVRDEQPRVCCNNVLLFLACIFSLHFLTVFPPNNQVKNKYYSRTKTPHQIIREHIDMFGES